MSQIEETSTTDVVDAYQRDYLNKYSTGPGDKEMQRIMMEIAETSLGVLNQLG